MNNGWCGWVCRYTQPPKQKPAWVLIFWYTASQWKRQLTRLHKISFSTCYRLLLDYIYPPLWLTQKKNSLFPLKAMTAVSSGTRAVLCLWWISGSAETSRSASETQATLLRLCSDLWLVLLDVVGVRRERAKRQVVRQRPACAQLGWGVNGAAKGLLGALKLRSVHHIHLFFLFFFFHVKTV